LIKDFEEFVILPEAKKYVIRLSITWEQLVLPGTCLGIWLLLRGQPARGESLFNKWGMQAPDLAKTRFVEDLHKS
jgi:hypothetical protein